MLGLKTLISSMKPYKEHSVFIDIIDEEDIIPDELQPLPPASTESTLPTAQDVEALSELHSKLAEARDYVSGHQAEESMIDQMLDFVCMLQTIVPIKSPEEQFLATKLLRTAFAAVPPGFLQRVRRQPEPMMAATFFFVTVLVTQPMFPAMGAMVSLR